jgi:TonB family protein
MKYFYLLLCLGFFITSCASSESTISESSFEYPKGCEESREPPQVLNMREAMSYHEYPAELRKKGIGGRVILSILVNEKGEIQNIEKVRSPHFDLTNSTINTAQQLRFKPGTCSGEPIAMPYEFSLNYKVSRGF